jgi:hypothetical protein
VEGERRSLPLDLPAAELVGAQEHGLLAGDWCPYGGPEELPPDQRVEDGLSLCSTSAPLEEPLELLGFPEATLTLSADRPQALVCVRLCDVAPDGASTLVTRGLLNLTHRDGHEQPAPLVPGERYPVRVRLSAIAHAFQPGHRVRVAVSPTYWPWAWPSPEPVTLTVHEGRLELPVRLPRLEDDDLAPFGPPEGAAALETEVLRAKESGCRIEHDVATGRFELTFVQDYGGRRRLPSGIEFETTGADVFAIVAGDPLSASTRSDRSTSLARGDWEVRVETSSVLSADADAFLATNAVEAFEGDVRIFAKSWARTIPRNLV